VGKILLSPDIEGEDIYEKEEKVYLMHLFDITFL
jgi:hypothetical protein